MNDKHKRSLRRFHRARMQRRASRVLREWDGWSEPMSETEFHARVSKHRDNLAICSCYSCRNPRTSMWGCYDDHITMQERKENDRFEYDMEEAVALLYDRQYGKEIQEE